MRGTANGFRSRRGRADVKYQYQGLVPQAEAPSLGSEGKTLERKAESSGQSGVDDRQKNVSMGIERARPMTAPKRPAGSKALQSNAVCAWRPFPGALKRRYRL